MLPLWFKDPADYDKIRGTDKVSILDLQNFKPGQEITVEIKHEDGNKEQIQTTSSINEGQWEWFKAGSGMSPSFHARSRLTRKAVVLISSTEHDGRCCQGT